MVSRNRSQSSGFVGLNMLGLEERLWSLSWKIERREIWDLVVMVG